VNKNINQTLKYIGSGAVALGIIVVVASLSGIKEGIIGARVERDTESRLVTVQRHNLETLTGTICPAPQDPSRQKVYPVQDNDREKSYLLMYCADGQKVYIPLGKPIIE